MIIGFTGTQQGMTIRQKFRVIEIISYEGWDIERAHHGCCVGADFQFHQLLVWLGVKDRIVLHPPEELSKVPGELKIELLRQAPPMIERRSPLPYLDRNHEMVDEIDLLIATPKEEFEITRSGTWATIRYARVKGISARVITPEGVKQ